MLHFETTVLPAVPWGEFDQFEDRMIYQTRPWLDFLMSTQKVEPVVALIKKNRETVGIFTGFRLKRLGCGILASPLNGWTTAYMGFNLRAGVSREEVLEDFPDYVFSNLSCNFFQIGDRHCLGLDYSRLKLASHEYPNLEVNLDRSEEDLFASMKGDVRTNIRKAESYGVRIEEITDMRSALSFANEYYAQLKEVFAKHGLVPTYHVSRVINLIQHLFPTGNLLLLRAMNSDGVCIATGLFPAYKNYMHFWGGASWRKYQILRPNEALMWHAMRYWRARGVKTFDLGGWASYKKKYGADEIRCQLLMQSRPECLVTMRNQAQTAWRRYHKLISRIKLNTYT